MKHLKSFIFSFLALFIIMSFTACNDESSVVNPEDENLTDQEVLTKLADEDEVLLSFDPNYNEDDGSTDFILGKINTEIYPVRVKQRMWLVNRNLNITFEGDTAYGILTKTFDGVLFIAASYDPFIPSDTNVVDTIITKEFTTVVTRNLIFEKVRNTPYPILNWRLAAISLPEGGTEDENIDITKLTIFLPNGDSLVIESPNEYYLSRGPGFFRQIPILSRGETVTLRLELESAYADTDFVTLTYGAIHGHHHRAKKRFELVSSNLVGGVYQKVYEGTWTTNQRRGFKHAIINAVPRQVVFDDSTPVEVDTWGVPYVVSD